MGAVTGVSHSGNPVQQGWLEAYDAKLEGIEKTDDPAQKRHLQAELKVMKLTLDKLMRPSSAGEQPASASTDKPAQPGADQSAPPRDAAAPAALPAKSAAPPNGEAARVAAPGAGGSLGPGATPALQKFAGEIDNAAKLTGMPANVLAAMMWQESRGQIDAGSHNANGLTDTGLMQVNPETFRSLQDRHPVLRGRSIADPATNIAAAAFYLRDMYQQFGSLSLALRAYNSGPNGVERGNPNATPAGTGDPTYVDKVLSFSRIIAGGGELPA